MRKFFVAVVLSMPLPAFAGNWGGTNFAPSNSELAPGFKARPDVGAEMAARGVSAAEWARFVAAKQAAAEGRAKLGASSSAKIRK